MSASADSRMDFGRLSTIALLAAVAFYLYNSVTYYLGAGRDDTFITLWTGISLAQGQGLVNYNIEPVEMSSSLLHTLVIGGIYAAAPHYVYAINKALGLAAGAILLIVLHRRRYALFGDGLAGIIALAVTYLGLANSRSWLYWNLGGLETPYQTLILFLYGLYLVEFWKSPANTRGLIALQILYVFVRPEGFLLLIFTTSVVATRAILSRPFRGKQAATLIGIPALALLAITTFRFLRFGVLLPNPVYAKVHLGIDDTFMSTLTAGLSYVKGFYTSSPYAAVQPAILVLLLIWSFRALTGNGQETSPIRSTPDITLMVWPWLILLNNLFVITTGGDWMEFFRFMAPIVPLSVVLTTLSAFRAIRHILDKHGLPPRVFHGLASLAPAVLLLSLTIASSGQRDNYATQDFHNCSEQANLPRLYSLLLDFERLDERLILMNCAGSRDWNGVLPFITDELPKMHDSLQGRLTIATFQMGFFPYYVRRVNPDLKIDFIDTLGIADARIAHMRMPKARYGISEGTDIVSILSGKSGALSEYILGRNPNMIYVLQATKRRRQALAELGWTIIWDRPGAVIFIKDGTGAGR